MDRAREPLQQASPAQHALDRIRRFGDGGEHFGRQMLRSRRSRSIVA
jgi:hypothetical protein